jgi:predicted nucleic acid-binding protein
MVVYETPREPAASRRSAGNVLFDIVRSRHVFPRPESRNPMTRFVVDSTAVLHLASEGIEVAAEHELLAPTLLRSQTLSALHEAVARGEVAADAAREQLARIGRMPIRLLGDAVLRRRAWEVADRLGWASTFEAEYVALTELQADAFITLDEELARSVEGIVATAPIDALR